MGSFTDRPEVEGVEEGGWERGVRERKVTFPPNLWPPGLKVSDRSRRGWAKRPKGETNYKARRKEKRTETAGRVQIWSERREDEGRNIRVWSRWVGFEE